MSNICVNANAGGSGGTGGTGATGGTAGTAGTAGSGGSCNPDGCQAIDVLFAIDGSGSMNEEIAALTQTAAFQEVIAALAAVNCGNIDYRVGVTGDNDNGFLVPSGWGSPNPWFDSLEMTDMEMVAAFSSTASAVIGTTGTDEGCEHVLSSAVDLLYTDATGFVRDGALLVLVLITDVDDYGAYDQVGGHSCGAIGCTTPPTDLQLMVDHLLELKDDDAAAVAAIVVAGDPAADGGVNLCNQPGSCNCIPNDVLLRCDAFHATRLWQFAGMLQGTNGFTANICGGPTSVPTAVQDAFNGAIGLACETYEPPK